MLKFVIALQIMLADRLRDEKGATAVEYGLMLALIAIVMMAAVTLVGTNLRTTFLAVAAAL